MTDSVHEVTLPGVEGEHTVRNIAITTMLIVILYMVSVFFYHKFEGWDYLNATYFVTMTITTIGYGDLVPKTPEGKLFTIFLALTGISLAFLLIASIAFYREKMLDRHLAKRISILKSISTLQRPPEEKRKPKQRTERMGGLTRLLQPE